MAMFSVQMYNILLFYRNFERFRFGLNCIENKEDCRQTVSRGLEKRFSNWRGNEVLSEINNLREKCSRKHASKHFRVSEYFCPPITGEVKGVSGACSDTAEREKCLWSEAS